MYKDDHHAGIQKHGVPVSEPVGGQRAYKQWSVKKPGAAQAVRFCEVCLC